MPQDTNNPSTAAAAPAPAAPSAAAPVAKAKPRAKKVAAPAGTAPAAPAAAPGAPITVKHRNHKGDIVERTFSKEVHGDDFAAKADEFKVTNAAVIVPDDTPLTRLASACCSARMTVARFWVP
jgi:hypothetical protein